MTKTTIVANIDGNGVKALYSEESVDAISGRMAQGVPVKCEGDEGTIYVNPSVIVYLQEGRANIPVSSLPSSTSSAEHGSLVSGVHQ